MHAKAPAPLGDARRPRLAAVPEPLVFACPLSIKGWIEYEIIMA